MKTKPGADASKLPTHEAKGGTGDICSTGITDWEGGKYLPYAPNSINRVTPSGMDVISYNFSGCIMAAYTDENGVRHVCHVATSKEKDQDCQEKWKRIQLFSARTRVIVEFKPSDLMPMATKQDYVSKGHFVGDCYGIITADNRCFAVFVSRDLHSGKRTIVDQRML